MITTSRIIKDHLLFRIVLLTCLLSILPLSQASSANLAIQLNVTGAIGPATQDYIERGIEYARQHEAAVIILRLDTPGGLDASMRGIVKAILGSSVPVVTYVAPEGARAASAGTYILYASHIAAMAPGTNLGASSPISILSGPNSKTSTVLEKKMMNDASAYIRSLSEIRGRNSEWAEQSVRESVSISASEALNLKVIDYVANNIPDLLQKINGRNVLVINSEKTLQTANAEIETIETGWRYKFLSTITDPNFAYILLLIGVYGIVFELYNPGMVLPGVVGAISLLLAMYAFQLLPVNYTGFSLLILGIIFMIIEVIVSSFGVIGIGGVIAFVLGSIFLLDSNQPGFTISWQLILLMLLVTAGFFLTVVNLAVRSTKRKTVTGKEALIGKTGDVISLGEPDEYYVKLSGELWKARANQKLIVGEKVRVTDLSGLLVTVEPLVAKQADNTRLQ